MSELFLDIIDETRRIPGTGELWQPQVTDRVRIIESGETTSILGFYTYERVARRFFKDPVRALTSCHPAHGQMGLIEIEAPGQTRMFCRPFHLEWLGASDEDVQTVRRSIDAWQREVEDSIAFLTGDSHPGLFARFPEPSNHEKLEIASWRRHVSQKIQEARSAP